MTHVYLVVEEPEVGYYGECDNHTTLSAHRSEAGADGAVEEWKAAHAGPRGRGGARLRRRGPTGPLVLVRAGRARGASRVAGVGPAPFAARLTRAR
jgi:hypothetical protein